MLTLSSLRSGCLAIVDSSDMSNRVRMHSFQYNHFNILSSPRGEIELTKMHGGNAGTPADLESVVFKRPGKWQLY